VRATDDGGFLRTMSSNGNLSAWLVAVGEQAGVRLTEGVRCARLGKARVDAVLAQSPIAEIAKLHHRRDWGITGWKRRVDRWRPGRPPENLDDRRLRQKASFGFFTTNGSALVSIRESTAGSGLLMIGDENSTPMAKMVVNDDRYGVVLAGPGAGFPLVPKVWIARQLFSRMRRRRCVSPVSA
jgi:hypothetical protein